jgi:hypothetical protein
VKALPDAWAGRDSLACGPGRFPLGMGDGSCSSTTDGSRAAESDVAIRLTQSLLGRPRSARSRPPGATFRSRQT